MATVLKKGTSKQEIVKNINNVSQKRRKKELLKLAGTLKADIDPLVFQKKLRDEWD